MAVRSSDPSTSDAGNRVALFDLDSTVLDCNSGRLWVQHEWREGRVGMADVAWAAYWLTRYGLGFDTRLDEAMTVAVRSVAGLDEATLDARVRTWFSREVAHRMRPGAKAVLAAHREQGDRIVLATSGTTYAARAAADAFGFDEVIATELEAEAGVLTGRIRTLCLGEGKTTAVTAWASAQGVDLAQAAFYTDSNSDRTLLEAVGHPKVVHPDRALRRVAAARGWPVLDWQGA